MIGDLKPYAAYKDSDVPWLGKVPEHWDVRPLFSTYHSKLVRNLGMIEKTVLSLSYGQIIVKPEEKLHGLVPESFETYQIVDPGNIIIRTTDLQNDKVSLRVGLVKDRGIITSAYLCLQVKQRLLKDYGYLLLNAYDLLKIFYGYGSGLRQNLDFTHIKRMPVLAPPIEEQTAIATFLDYADRRIRRYIRSKQKLIKLLEEEKQVVINEAVTRGLDPNVPMKRSGIEWLGDVPEHWEVKRLKLLFREVDSRSTTGKEILLSLRMHRGLVPHNEVSEKPIEEEALKGFKKVTMGQLVMNRMRAAIGMFATVPQIGIVSPDYAIFEPIKTADPSYYVSLFKTSTLCSIFRLESKGLGTGSSGFMRLYTDRFGLIKVPVPPKEEQEAITLWIQKTTQEFETAKQRAAQEIVLLNEFRTRMIADVVTGKLDVREAAAKLPVEIDELEALDEDLDEDVMGLEDELDPDAAPEDDAA